MGGLNDSPSSSPLSPLSPSLPTLTVSLIIPALNEAECLKTLLLEVPGALLYEIIVVDNGSTDDTAAVARAAGVQVVSEPRRGYGYACAAGVAAASGDVLVFMDGDGSFVPQELTRLVEPIQQGQADFVLGTRLRGGMAAVFQNGKLVFVKITPETEGIVQKFKKGDVVNGFTFKNDLELHSAGGGAGNFGKIIINGKDYSLAQRGFNLVVVDKDFKVLKTAFFDTFDDCYSGEVKK